MKQLMFVLTIAILLLSNPFAVKAEDIPKVERPDLFGLMVTATESETVTVGNVDYLCTTTYYYKNGKEHINGVFDRCLPLTSTEPTPEPEPDPNEEPSGDITTIWNGAPDINVNINNSPKRRKHLRTR